MRLPLAACFLLISGIGASAQDVGSMLGGDGTLHLGFNITRKF
jgi:hypothetical protein